MKKFTLPFLLILIALLTACSNESIGEVTTDYPETVKDEIKKLPDNVKENMAVPTKLPSESYDVQFSYESDPINDPTGDIINTTFVYVGENPTWHLQLTTWHGNASASSYKDKQKVTLENGIEAEMSGTDNDNQKGIEWKNKNGKIHSLTLLEHPDKEPQFTMDDLIEIANSMG